MNIVKRTLAFFLICALCITMPAVFAEEGVNTELAPALSMLVNIGVVDKADAIKPQNAYMSRAEFAMNLVRLRGSNNVAVGMDKIDIFKDVDFDYEESRYILLATQLGYMGKPADGFFKPTDPVDYNTVIKGLVDILGYTPYANLNNGTNTAYMMEAGKIGVLKGISMKDTYPDRGSIYQMMINSANIDILKPTEYGEETTVQTVKDQTLLSEYHDIKKTKGIITANDITALDGVSGAVGKQKIKINGVLYDVSLVPNNDLLGYHVEVYYKDNEGENNVMFLQKTKNDTLMIKAEEIISDGNMTYQYEVDGKNGTAEFKSAYVLYNGTPPSGEKFRLTPLNGQVTLLDNNNDGIYDVVFIEDGMEISVKNIVAEKGEIAIYGKYGNAFAFPEQAKLLVQHSGTGMELKLEQLTAKTIVTVFADENKGRVHIKASNMKITGKVTEISDSKELRIGDESYKLSPYFIKAIKDKKTGDIKLNNDYEFYLNCYGEIADVVTTTGRLYGGYEYGILINGKVKSLSDGLQVKIFDSMNEMNTFSVSKNVYIDNVRQNSIQEAFDTLCKKGEMGVKQANVVPQLIRFQANENRVVTHIDKVGEPTESADKLIQSYDGQDGSLSYYAYTQCFKTIISPKLVLKTPVYVFHVPMDASGNIMIDDDSLFVAGAASSLTDGKNYKFTSYKTDPNALAEEVIITAVSIGADGKPEKLIPSESPLCIFLKSAQVLDDEGNAVTEISYNEEGFDKAAIVSDDVNISALTVRGGETYSLKKGDLFVYVKDLNGEIIRIEAGYDRENDRMIGNNWGVVEDESYTTWRGTYSRYLDKVNIGQMDSDFTMMTYVNPCDVVGKLDPTKKTNWTIFPTDTIFNRGVFVYDSEKNQVTKVTVTDGAILDYKSAGNAYSKVFYWHQFATFKCLVVYK